VTSSHSVTTLHARNRISLALALSALVASNPALAQDSAADCASQNDLIGSIKRLEQKLGFRKTKNFQKTSEETAADYRCYYTGKLELPDSYEGLKFRFGTASGCPLDTKRPDVFFYPLEAKASGRTPLTTSLAHESRERFMVVVPHEDFHATPELKKLPATLNEAASTLVGFLIAIELARQEFGEQSDVYRNLEREPELFRRKADLVNRYHARLRRVYATWRASEISEPSALAQKQQAFEGLLSECRALKPDPKSFNKCLAANNNAGLAYDATYTKYYILMYDLYVTEGQKLEPTLTALRGALSARTEAEAVQNLRALIKTQPASAAGLPPILPGPAPVGSPSCCSTLTPPR